MLVATLITTETLECENMSTLHRPLQLGFIGGGVNSAVGYTHFLASRLDGFFQVAAGCFSRDRDVNKASAAKFGVPINRCYASAEALLANEKLDAICILTPTPNHKSDVIAALEAGFNVICEKALTTSVSDAAEIARAEKKSGRKLVVTFNYVGYPMVREAQAMIRAGRLGKLQQIYCEMPQETFAFASARPQSWRRQDYEIPCVSLDLGVHVLHMVQYLASELTCNPMAASERTFGKIPDVIDTVNVLATCSPDVLVSMMWGKASLGKKNGLKFRACGDQGSLEWDQSWPEHMTYCSLDGGTRFLERGQEGLFEANCSRYNRFKSGHPAGFVEAFANIYADFADILTGDNTPIEVFEAQTAQVGLAVLDRIHQIASEQSLDSY